MKRINTVETPNKTILGTSMIFALAMAASLPLAARAADETQLLSTPRAYAIVGVCLLIVHHFICKQRGTTVPARALVVPQTSKRPHFNAVQAAENPVRA